MANGYDFTVNDGTGTPVSHSGNAEPLFAYLTTELRLALGHSNGWICTFLRIA